MGSSHSSQSVKEKAVQAKQKAVKFASNLGNGAKHGAETAVLASQISSVSSQNSRRNALSYKTKSKSKSKSKPKTKSLKTNRIVHTGPQAGRFVKIYKLDRWTGKRKMYKKYL